ncbi:MAG: flippase [Mucilaginibacter sp.]|uniref:flippase n=1 Tax=Mucilaginibacter sp. TaxID=1882438 RepID=UPI0034E5C234
MAKNYFYNLLLTLANLLFPILSFPYISRVLGPDGIGKVQFIFSFAYYFAIIAGLGIPIYGMKEIARFKDDKEGRSRVFSELTVIYVVSSICLSIVYLAVVYTFPYFKVDRDMYLAALLLILLGCSYMEWVYTGMEEFKSIALRSVLFKVIGLLLMFLFIKTASDYKLYLYLMLFSFLGNNVLSIFLLKGKVRLLFSGLLLRKHLMPLFFIFGTTIAVIMADTDTVLLGFIADVKAVGLYTAADKLSMVSIPIVTSLAVILMPQITKDFADKNMLSVQNTLNQAFKFLVFLGVPIVFGLALLAPEFIALFSGKQFLEATNSMRLLSVLPLTVGFSRFLQYLILVPSGKNREMFLCVIGGLVVSLALNILLIPSLRQVGSSIANVSSELVVTASYFYIITKHFSFTYQWSLLVKAVISALIFIPLIWMVKQLELPLAYMLIISIGGCALAYTIIQMFLFKNNFVFIIINIIKVKMDKTIKA